MVYELTLMSLLVHYDLMTVLALRHAYTSGELFRGLSLLLLLGQQRA